MFMRKSSSYTSMQMVEKSAKRAEDILIKRIISRDQEDQDTTQLLKKVTGTFDLIR